ncbi:D-glycero-beta-D-manno-heptose 1-phosphate adenylyltransferase [bacterium]|nr:D-glycero-beta-D-manno-heptose 1-phosphate adenylyltransferase [bacterium]
MRDKIYASDELITLLGERRRAGELKKIVFTNGCFDLLHVGHLRYLWEARTLGDALVVAINDDNSIRRLKGEGRPVLKLQERLEVLAGLACVDYVTWFTEDTPIPLLEKMRPEVLVKGGTYPVEGVVGREVALTWGADVRVLSVAAGRSTTALIDKIKEAGKK